MDGVKAGNAGGTLDAQGGIWEELRDINKNLLSIARCMGAVNKSLATIAEGTRAEDCAEVVRQDAERERMQAINRNLERIAAHLDAAEEKRIENEVFNL